MTDKKLTVTLAGKAYAATVPLTLGQLEDLNVAVMLPSADNPQEEVRQNFKRNIGIILAALAPEHPELTDLAIRNMRSPNAEFTKAVSDILDASGLFKKAAAPGEAAAETIKAA
jgi:soluble P-type ATPase